MFFLFIVFSFRVNQTNIQILMKTYFYTNEEGELRPAFNVIKIDDTFYVDDLETLNDVKIEFRNDIHIPCLSYEALQSINHRLDRAQLYALTLVLEMKAVERHLSAYKVERCYGGPEEGGWWFDGYTYLGPAESNPEDDDNGTPLGYSNSNGKVVHIYEFFIGDNETKSTPHYS